MSYYNF